MIPVVDIMYFNMYSLLNLYPEFLLVGRNTHTHTHIYIYIYIYIYTYRERERGRERYRHTHRERERERESCVPFTWRVDINTNIIKSSYHHKTAFRVRDVEINTKASTHLPLTADKH